MATYISPTGNPELWKTRPSGYYTQAEWDAMHTPPPAPVPTLEEARSKKLAEVMTKYSAAFAPFTAVYPAEEREGWAEQKAEALAYLADPAAPTPVLTELINLRAAGETVTEFAQLVLVKSKIWTAVYAHLTGQQQRMYKEVILLSDIDAILAYPVTYNLPEGL